uniref:Beta-galactosidase 1-like first all-beta domain-containing protein n=1 Tax=Panagrolaimus superbus TaxID=310955 RepID=A0A914Y0R5_9BILA
MTSYDWGAPISENGEIRSMYTAIQNWIRKLPNWDHPPLSVPKNNSVKAYGKIKVRKYKSLLKTIDHPYGFVLYRKVLEFDGSNLTAENIKDHGFVYINDKAQGVLVDNLDKYSKKWISLSSAKKGDILTIIVENRGRQTYLSILDSKVGFITKCYIGWSNCNKLDPMFNRFWANIEDN